MCPVCVLNFTGNGSGHHLVLRAYVTNDIQRWMFVVGGLGWWKEAGGVRGISVIVKDSFAFTVFPSRARVVRRAYNINRRNEVTMNISLAWWDTLRYSAGFIKGIFAQGSHRLVYLYILKIRCRKG